MKEQANVAFIGKFDDGRLKDVPEFVQVVRQKVMIPKGTKHGEGFYSEQSALLINSGNDFKAFVSKGDK